VGCHRLLPASRVIGYVEAPAREAGEAAEIAAARKSTKYPELENRYIFQPIAVESLGPINDSAVSFLSVLGSRIANISGEVREVIFLFQRLSVLIQRSNAILLHDGPFIMCTPNFRPIFIVAKRLGASRCHLVWR